MRRHDHPEVDDLHRMIDGLRIPPHVAAMTYPRGVRIRRVRVPVAKQPPATGEKRPPVILSRRALKEPDDARS